MRELGVIYNSSYYSISEHPGYQGAGDNVEASINAMAAIFYGPELTTCHFQDDEDEDEEDDDEEEVFEAFFLVEYL